MDGNFAPTVSHEEIAEFVRAWAEENGQEIDVPGPRKHPWMVCLQAATDDRTTRLLGENDAAMVSPNAWRMDEALFPYVYQRLHWFNDSFGAAYLCIAAAGHFHPERPLMHKARAASERESLFIRGMRDAVPLIYQNQSLVMFVNNWCHEQGWDPWDPELPFCYYVYAELESESEIDLERLLDGEDDYEMRSPIEGNEQLNDLFRRALDQLNKLTAARKADPSMHNEETDLAIAELFRFLQHLREQKVEAVFRKRFASLVFYPNRESHLGLMGALRDQGRGMMSSAYALEVNLPPNLSPPPEDERLS